MSLRSAFRRRTVLALLGVGVLVTAVGLGLFQPWKLFVDDVVNEAAPAGLAELAAPGAGGPAGAGDPAGPGTPTGPGGPTEPSASPPTSTSTSPATSTSAPASARPPTPGGRPTRAGGPGSTAAGTPAARVVASGTFLSHEHATTGRVRVVALPGGDRVLRIDDLDTSNGPDLRVWLTDAPVLQGRAGWFVFDDGARVELGRLKGNRGSQNYALPASVDLRRLTGLSIWCARFRVSFGAALIQSV